MGPNRQPKPGHRGKLRFRIVTVSTSKYAKKTRSEETNDESGDIAERMVRRAGNVVRSRILISDDVEMLREQARKFLEGSDDVAVFVGGTGISPKDLTIETLRPLFEKELEGFGELLRSKSYPKVGAAAFLTRATAGVSDGKLIVCTPGSPDAVRTGLRLLVGEIPTIIRIARS